MKKLGPAMESAGFDRQVETTWIWEGVIPYLTAGAVTSTVAQLAELSAPAAGWSSTTKPLRCRCTSCVA